MQISGNNNKVRIVFFGSGPVAKKSLELLAQNFEIEAVITKSSTLKDMQSLNLSNKVSYYAVNNKSELDSLFAEKVFTSNLGVLIDFGIIVSQKIIDYFKLGIINSHFSLLPQWRGPDPITSAVLSGQKQTGVSLMLLVQAMDEGPILEIGTQKIAAAMTASQLTKSLIYLSDTLLQHAIPNYLADPNNKGIPQEKMTELMNNYPSQPSYSHKLTKQNGILDFAKPAELLEREIRAFIEWPKSRTSVLSQDVIVTQSRIVNKNLQPGLVLTGDKKIIIGCKKDSLEIIKLKPAGKSEMTAQAFLLGYLKK